MDANTIVPILLPAIGVSIAVTLTGLCCFRSTMERNAIQLRNRIESVEQQLQNQLRVLQTIQSPPPSAPLAQTQPAMYYPQLPQQFYAVI